MNSIRLTDLPEEVIQNVLFRLDYATALAVEATCRRFRDVANEPLLWKSFCQDGWKKWHPRHKFKAKVAGSEFTGWKALFAERTRSSRETRVLVEGIVGQDLDRIPKVERIVELGWDAKDALLETFRNAHLNESNVLAQRYWSQEVLGCLHRAMALNVWTKLDYENPDEQPFIWSLGAFDLFVLTASRPGDIEDIFTRLNFYVACIREDYPGVGELCPRDKATLVARYLQAKGWTGIHGDRDYHNIEHNFLGVALYGEGHNSLPLITVVIYCYVVRELGLRAAPCSFPMHVYAVVRPPEGLDLNGNALDDEAEDPAMYVDPYRSDEEVPLSSLTGQLRIVSHRFSDAEVEAFLSESDARDISLRCARNIFNSQQSIEIPLNDVDKFNAMYGAAWASALVPRRLGLPHPEDLILLMQAFFENSIFDVGLIQRYILPLCVDLGEYNQYMKECRAIRRRDEVPKWGRDRTGRNAVVKYRVGQVFRHRRYDYIGAITGWDHECSSGEAWIRQMRVDRLPKGRNQPFYHILEVNSSSRYVAEENIEIISIDKKVADSFPLEAGQYFKRWDDEQKVFISNIRSEYRED